jgi:hypothetical protein
MIVPLLTCLLSNRRVETAGDIAMARHAATSALEQGSFMVGDVFFSW